MNTLSLISIAESFEKEIGVTREEAVKMAKLTKGYAYAFQVLGYIMFGANKSKIDEEVIRFKEYVQIQKEFD